MLILASFSIRSFAQNIEHEIFEGDGFKIIWSGAQSGTIFYEPDKYSQNPYEFVFNNYLFCETINITNNKNTTNSEKFGEVIISKDCAGELLERFVELVRAFALQELWDSDFTFLDNNNYIKNGRDYCIDEKGKISNCPGKKINILYQLKANLTICSNHVEGNISQESKIKISYENCRLYGFNDIYLLTNSYTGERTLIKVKNNPWKLKHNLISIKI